MLCPRETPALTFETLMSDPMVRLAMASDDVSEEEMLALLETIRRARDAWAENAAAD
jgi:hypothetical protein